MYQFIPRGEMRSILDIADFPINGRAETAYRYFLNNQQEAMYIEEKGILIGVVSIGDLERYYGGREDKLEINSRFSYIDEIDEARASVFWGKFKTFFECPVVDGRGQLKGVMKRDIRYDIRQDQIASLVTSRYLREQWHRKELHRFVVNTKAKVVLYYVEEAAIRRKIDGRKKSDVSGKDEEIYWKGLTKSQWDDFLGESDIVGSLKKEFGNFHTQLVKGISEIVDMKGEFYNCVGGSRITVGNPNEPDGRIIFYGACNAVGAYCRDEETMESCFQRMLNAQMEPRILVINRGLFNVSNFFSRMMTDELSEKDIAVIYVEKRWLTEEISGKCAYVGSLTDAFLRVEDLENNILDSPDHCNYRVNKCLAEQMYHDFKEQGLFDIVRGSGAAERIQDYYIGSEIMSEVLRYMERNELLRGDETGIKGAMTLLADPFTERHRRAVEKALKKVDKLYLFISEDSNLQFTLEQRIRAARAALQELEDRIMIVPAGKYLYTKKISRGIRKQKFCDEDMEYDCDIFGEIFGRFMGIRYRFVLSELDNPVEQRYMGTCVRILPRFGIAVEEL